MDDNTKEELGKNVVEQQNKEDSNDKQNKKGNEKVIVAIICLLIVSVSLYLCLNNKDDKNETEKEIEVEKTEMASPYRLSGNSLEDFDLYFLQLDNVEKNRIYSPLSIKYTLEMLKEGANGETKEQITDIVGNYTSKKYINNQNMSFANALFIKDTFKENIKGTYISNLSTNYNAEVIYDSFETPNVINSWISNNTFKLINNIVDDVSDNDFVLVNALAIDMEWVNKIQQENGLYEVNFTHENYSKYISGLASGYTELKFNNASTNSKAVEIGAVANKYDIISTLGEDKIRENVGNEYSKWLKNGAENSCNGPGEDPDVNTFLDGYIDELKENYKHISSSTDFYFYDDDNVKAFAKDLKEYSGTTLQYVGIMPKKYNLNEYIKNIDSKKISNIINDLKKVELDSFKDGVITEVKGYIPMFKFDYELDLINNLKQLGITNVFDSSKADLSNLSSSNAVIGKVSHKANIEFSNDGIKASAATVEGGLGAGFCGFDYEYDVPVETIDLTFDNPYLFLIIDKDTKEVWFTGTVYEPVAYK